MPINTEKLKDMGIVKFEVKFQPDADVPHIAEILKRNGLDKRQAQIVTLTAIGVTLNLAEVKLGTMEAVIHAGFDNLNLPENMDVKGNMVYIYGLYTEPGYEGLGIATTLLELLPEFVLAKLGFQVGMFVLAAVPQIKNEYGFYKTMPMEPEFLIKLMQLVSFYSARGFSMSADMLHMYKIL